MATSYASRLGTAPEEAIKAPCVASTTANITLSGAQTIDSVAVVAGNRVLVRSQTDPTENGIYDVKTGAWTRSTDWNAANDVIAGMLVMDSNAVGADGISRLYGAVYSGTYSPGTTSLTFDKVIEIGSSAAGDGAILTDKASVNQVVDNALCIVTLTSAATDTYAGTVSIDPAAYATGIRFQFVSNFENVGACSLNVNANGAKNIKLSDGNDPYDGAIQNGGVVDLLYDGTDLILLNPWRSNSDATTLTQRPSTNQVVDNTLTYCATDSAVGTDAYAVSLPVSPGAYVKGNRFQFKTDVANTGACTVDFNSLGAKNIKLLDGNDPYNGAIQAGAPVDVMYDDTNMVLLNPFESAVGKQTIWIPAAAIQPTVSNGCSSINTVETTSGRPDLQVLDFDPDTDEFGQFQVAFPKSWNLGTVTYQIYFTLSGTNGGVIYWNLAGVSVPNNSTIDVIYGTAIVVTDTGLGTTEFVHVTDESAALTIAGAPADDELSFFRVSRDANNGSDTQTLDARLIGIKLHYTTDLVNDE